jgi:ubiquinone/menaquinone biosynthesis C-methylase UbiE
MINEKIKEQYRVWASTYDEDKVKLFKDSGIDYQEFMDSLIEVCGLKPGMNILDVGAGTGLTSIAIAKALVGNCKILAIEPVDEMIEKARVNIQKEGFNKIINVEKATAENIPCGNETYDLIICTFAIRHMDIEKALKEFARVLKPNGKIVIADIAAPEKWRSLLGKIIMPIMQLMISRKYKGEIKSKVLTTNEWKNLIEKLNLKIVQIVEFPGKRDPEWELKRVIISLQRK